MLYIEKTLLDELIANVESVRDECCGFLFGYEHLENRTVTKTMVAENVTQGKRDQRFEIAPLEYLSAERFADQNNLQLLGIYHSHPNHSALPSEHDRLAAYPNFSYVILSVTNQKFTDIRSWRLNGAFQFEEEKINSQKIN